MKLRSPSCAALTAVVLAMAGCSAPSVPTSQPAAPAPPPAAPASLLPGFTPVSYSEAQAPPISLDAGDGTKLALRSIKGRTVVEAPLAFTELHLTFDNPSDRRIEAHFRMQLPPGASLSRLSMRVGDHFQEGEMLEKQAARRTFEDFLHRKQDPALLEQGAGNEVAARVFPIAPHEQKEIIVAYSQELGAAGASLVRMAGLPEVAAVDLAVYDGDAATPAASFVRASYVPDRDLALGAERAAGHALRGGGRFVASFVPASSSAPAPLRSLALLVDTSGSRALGLESELEIVQRLVAALVADAGPDAALAIGCFDQEAETVYAGRAGDFGPAVLQAIRARGAFGASNLEAALRWAAGVAKRDRLARAVLVGDGVPTAGPTEGTALATAARALGDAGVQRLDAVMVGGLRDEAALRQLVTAGLPSAGMAVDGALGGEAVVKKLRREALWGVALEVPGATWLWPRTLDGVAPGDVVTVYGELDDASPLSIRAGAERATVSEARPAEPALLERAVARAKIDSLLARQASEGASAELQREIVTLSTTHRVLSPYTALLVLETEADYQRFGIERQARARILGVANGRVTLLDRAAAPAGDGTAAPLPADDTRTAMADDDPLSARGNMWGDEIGESFGAGGLGLTGIGEGGGGRGEAIALGAVGSVGHGSGTGTGQGFGSGQGRLAGSHRVRPPQVRMGATSVSGRLPPEVIQRIVRQNFGRMRLCYERGLQQNPSLQGRVSVAFTIGRDGSVAAVRADGDLPDGAVSRCIASAFQGLSFPAPEGGIVTVTYPFVFSPNGDGGTRVATGAVQTSGGQVPDAEPVAPEVEQYTGEFAAVMSDLAAGNPSAAFTRAAAWHAREPGDVLGLVALGEALESAGDRARAARVYGSIVDLYPARADLRRFAGNRLERLADPGARALAEDTYAKAVADRPDHAAGHHLLAMARLQRGEYGAAFEQAAAAFTSERGFAQGVDQILREDLGIIAQAWIAAEPARREELVGRLATLGAALADKPSLRFVLSWETDANDVDLHVSDGVDEASYQRHELPSGGNLYADVTSGYGPECFGIQAAPAARAANYQLKVHYYARGPMGYGMGKVSVIAHDGAGHVTIDDRPFVVMNDHAWADVGSVAGRR